MSFKNIWDVFRVQYESDFIQNTWKLRRLSVCCKCTVRVLGLLSIWLGVFVEQPTGQAGMSGES